MDAIVYTSNTGFTAHYAQLLGERTQLPVYSLEEAKSHLEKGADIIYLGWLMAGQIKGYNQAARLYQVNAVCAVGMGRSHNTKIQQELQERYHLNSTPIFVLQGGFNMDKLSGIHKFMMTTMKNTVGKKLEQKSDKTPEEAEMAQLFMHGGDLVKSENLDPVLAWLEENGK